MKFWQKTYLSVLLVFLVTLDVGVFSLLNKSYSLNQQTETARAISQFNNISKTFDYIFNTYNQTTSKPDIKGFTYNFAKTYVDDKFMMEIYDNDGQSFYSNAFEFEGKRDELNSSSIETVYRKVNNRLYVFTGGSLSQSGYRMVITYDVNYLDEYFNSLLSYFIILSIVLSTVLSVLLIFLIRRLTAPFTHLNKAAKEIAEGAYEKRVIIKTKDEIGDFASNFNIMADAVSLNVVRLEQSAKEKEVFINNLTHELKTPITALKGYSSFLLNAYYSDEQRRMAEEYILEHTNRLNILSGKLMELLYLENETFCPRQVNVFNLFAYVENLEKLSLQSKSILLRSNCPNKSLVVMGDAALLQTLLINLIENSIKASESGEKILLNGYEKDKYIILEVQDHGLGIPPEELNKITQAFYTVDPSRSKANGGIGLGLSICKQIATLHNAELKVTSEPGCTMVSLIFIKN